MLTIRLSARLREAGAAATLHYRAMGATSAPFKAVPMGKPLRGSVFSASLPAPEDLEYYCTVGGLVWPPGAPATPHTVIVVGR